MDNSPNQTIIIPVTSQPKVVIIHLDSYSHLHGIPDKLGGINPELSITHVSVYVCILYKYIRDTGFASWRMLLRQCITTNTMTGGWLLLLVLPFFLGAPLDIYMNITPKNLSGIWFSYLKLTLLSVIHIQTTPIASHQCGYSMNRDHAFQARSPLSARGTWACWEWDFRWKTWDLMGFHLDLLRFNGISSELTGDWLRFHAGFWEFNGHLMSI